MAAILSAIGVSKQFPGVKALDAVDFELESGEVHALVGENGAGKSTLMQILAGVYTCDEGTITVDGVERDLGSKQASEAAGVAIVFQESSLLQNISVAENIFAGAPPVTSLGLIDWPRMHNDAADLLGTLEIDILPGTITGTLSMAEQKMVEIARALSHDFKILILDEPTAAITVEETEQLFTQIARLKADGKSIIYISHRLRELKQIADRVTILKDGERVGTEKMADISEAEICERMVGRELLDFQYQSKITDDVVLQVESLSGDGFDDVSLALRAGEFLTITGLSGAGRTELALTLFGELRPHSGRIIIDGSAKDFRTPGDAMKAGIGYVSEDRKTLGLFLDMTIAENMESNNIDQLTPGLLVSHEGVAAMATDNVEAFDIRCASIGQAVRTLSGGNQQKVCLSRWTSFRPKILIVDEPTLGVDVGSKEEIYGILNRLTGAGMAVIMISSDMIETLAMGDCVMVMHEGRVTRILPRSECREEEIVALASGIELGEDVS
jgi:ribose transport system ATP-binding protein